MTFVAQAIYLLCALTSLACAVLLARGYYRSKARILLWSTLCFAFLALNNIFLILDLVVFPNINFAPMRDLSGLIAMAILVTGLIWDYD